ncbi:MAG: catalase [Lachnospiraceae bacterium]|nr:catalase [Lachnospiraceae bacterium]
MGFWYNFRGHLGTILHHKKLVRRYCFRAGLYKQGIMHDWSKYSPVEFFNGVRFYQGGVKSPNHKERAKRGYSSAWLHHKGRNRHHYEYWIDFTTDASLGLQGMPMPTRYILEMFCDRVAASRNYNKDSYDDSFPLKYYEKNKSHYLLHPQTKELLERLLNMLAEEGEEKTFQFIRREIRWKDSPKH